MPETELTKEEKKWGADMNTFMLGRDLTKQVKYSDLGKWIRNFRENKDLPAITKSAIVELGDFMSGLQRIVDNYEKKNKVKPDGFRIYFIRYAQAEIEQRLVDYQLTPDKQLTQVSLVFVPTHNYKIEAVESKTGPRKKMSADDFTFLENGDAFIWCLPLAHIGDFGEGTGLCPPNCGGSFGDGG